MEKRSRPPRPGPAVLSRPGIRLALLALVAVAVSADVFRLGWFADDYHLLDVARRIPLAQALGGQHGIYPWYRPLSRELYYAVIVALGPLGLAFAHVARVACLLGLAWALGRLAARLLDPRLAMVAPLLLLTYAFTKFLAAWSAGFQDLLAAFLVLTALADFAEERRPRSLLWAALAPFAKETGFVALPLMIAYEALCRRQRRWRSWLPAQTAMWLVAAAIHVAVRLSWHAVPTGTRIERMPAGLARGLGTVLGGFVGWPPVVGFWAAVAAMAAGAGAALLLLARGAAPRAERAAIERPRLLRAFVFLLLAAATGLAPMVAGQLARLTLPHAYYAFPAVPWLALAAALGLGRLPRRLPGLVVPALVVWNTWCLGFATPTIGYSSWTFRRWDWPQAVRLSEFSRRLTRDLRDLLATRPESLVVVFRSLPQGCYFQTEDGPATREILRDPTVRSYYFHGLPMRVDREHLAILNFNAESRHLERAPGTFASALENSSYAAMCGNGWPAYAFASFADTTGPPRFALLYMCAAARLLEEGPSSYLDALALAGVTDSTGPTPDERAYAMIPRTVPLGVALAGVLRHPLSAASHEAYGALLEERDFLVSAGVEYRIAVTLDPARVVDRLRLAMIFMQVRDFQDLARAELERVRRDAPNSPLEGRARALIERLDAVYGAPAASGAR